MYRCHKCAAEGYQKCPSGRGGSAHHKGSSAHRGMRTAGLDFVPQKLNNKTECGRLQQTVCF